MHKRLRSFTFNSLILLAAAGSAACNLANVKADNSGADQINQAPVSANQNAENTASPANRPAKTAPPPTSASVAGTYSLNTVKNGSGNDNSLEIENKGNGKIGMSFSGAYVYKNEGDDSAHETEAEGDAQLKNNIATGNLYQYQDDDDSCHATITFGEAQATVKLSSGCHFNVALDGVYKKEKAKPNQKSAAENSGLRKIAYDKLDDFTNDTEHHQPGERYLIVNVPADKINKTSRADEFGNSSYKGLFYLQLNEDDKGVDSSFLTSAAMVKSLDENVSEYEPASLRATAVLVESNGKFDFYRMSFITKIEGLNSDGSVKWTATGAEPAKTKFTH